MPAKEIIEQQKTCAKCGETKAVRRFYPCPSNKDGFTDNCRQCRAPQKNGPRVTGGLKSCSGCGEMKPLSDFYENPLAKSGRSSRCITCGRKGWRSRHPIDPAKLVTPLPNEEWRAVVGLEGEYSVSNLGRVRGDRAVKRTWANRLLRQHLGNLGYYTVGLHHRTTMVHRLVAEAFLDPAKRHLTVNHKNGMRTDNRVENLEFVTHAENMAHAAGTLKRCGTRKLNEEAVRRIRSEFAKGGITRSALASRYSVAVGTISKAIDRVWWKHVE